RSSPSTGRPRLVVESLDTRVLGSPSRMRVSGFLAWWLAPVTVSLDRREQPQEVVVYGVL
ncbi:hypothetical protein LSAT2_033020, partial [Lamellibrachia satsuma]